MSDAEKLKDCPFCKERPGGSGNENIWCQTDGCELYGLKIDREKWNSKDRYENDQEVYGIDWNDVLGGEEETGQ